MGIFKTLRISFTQLNLGAKRLIISVAVMIALIQIYYFYQVYLDYSFAKDVLDNYASMSDEGKRTFFYAEGYNNALHLWYTSQRLLSKITIYPQPIYWGLVFFVLWIREGFKAKKEAEIN